MSNSRALLIEQAMQKFHPEGMVSVRIFLKKTYIDKKTGKEKPETRNGIYTDFKKLAVDLLAIEPEAIGLFHVVNQIKKPPKNYELNKLHKYGDGTKDPDIKRRVSIMIDIDPERKPKTSASELELQRVFKATKVVKKFLSNCDWADPEYEIKSGNGAHLFYRVDLPVNEQIRTLFQRILQALALIHNKDGVKIDLTVFNASRIMRIPGTMAQKGSSDNPDRPHRPCEIETHTQKAKILTPELLTRVAQYAVDASPAFDPAIHSYKGRKFTVKSFEQYAKEHNVEIVEPFYSWGDKARSARVNCVHYPGHKNHAFIVINPNGSLVYKCHTDTCRNEGYGTKDFRDKVEPGWREADNKDKESEEQSKGNGRDETPDIGFEGKDVEVELDAERRWNSNIDVIAQIFNNNSKPENRKVLLSALVGYLARRNAKFPDIVLLLKSVLRDNDLTTEALQDFEAVWTKALDITLPDELEELRPFLSDFDLKTLVDLFPPKQFEIPVPKTIDSSAFIGILGDIARFIEPQSEADPSAILLSAIVALGNQVGREPHFMVGADRHGLNEDVAIVGKTAKARKGQSWNPVGMIFAEADKKHVEESGLDFEGKRFWSRVYSGLSSGEGLIHVIRDPIVKMEKAPKGGDYIEVIADPGEPEKRALLMEPELSRVFKVMSREGNTLSPIIRQSWDGVEVLKTMTRHSPLQATNGHVSFIGHITLYELSHYINELQTASGFGNRFLFCHAQRSKMLPFPAPFDKEEMKKLAIRLKDVFVYAEENIEEITWDEKARAMWGEIYPELSKDVPGILGELTARSEAHTTRVACIYAVADKTDKIREEHLLGALGIWDFCAQSAKYIFRAKMENKVADKIYSALGTSPGMEMTRWEISNLFGRNKTAEEITEALELLQHLGRIKKETHKTDGRPKILWIRTT